MTHKLLLTLFLMIIIIPLVIIDVGITIYEKLTPSQAWYEIKNVFSINEYDPKNSFAGFVAGTLTIGMMAAFAGCVVMWYDRYSDKKDRG